MKKRILFTLLIVASLLVGCKSSFPVAQQTGKEDMAYLVFVGPRQTYGNGSKLVQVDVDGTKFDAKVVKPKVANRKYSIWCSNRKQTCYCHVQRQYHI